LQVFLKKKEIRREGIGNREKEMGIGNREKEMGVGNRD